MAVDVRYRNKRKFDIEEARNNDGTYQALKLFAKNTKVMVVMANGGLKNGYFWVEYERDGKPSCLADTRVEFFAINLDLRDRIYFIRANILRQKARRYFRIDEVKVEDNVKYVKVPMTEMITFD